MNFKFLYEMESSIAIAWKQLSVGVGNNPFRRTDKNNYILNKISGSFATNSINALMGPSGCGKSTLLKSLNGSQDYSSSKESKIYVRNDRKIIRNLHISGSGGKDYDRTHC